VRLEGLVQLKKKRNPVPHRESNPPSSGLYSACMKTKIYELISAQRNFLAEEGI
jgi:hypothetical protein